MMAHPQTKCSTHNWAKEMRQRERKQEYQLPEEPKFINLKKRPKTDNDPLTNVLQETFPPTDIAFHMLTAYPNSYYGTSRGSSSLHSSSSLETSSHSGSSVGSHSGSSAGTYIGSNLKSQNAQRNSVSKSGISGNRTVNSNCNKIQPNHHLSNPTLTPISENNVARNRTKPTKNSEGGRCDGFYQRNSNMSDKHSTRLSNLDSKMNRESVADTFSKMNHDKDFDRTKRRRAFEARLMKLFNVPTIKGCLFNSTKRTPKVEMGDKHTQNKSRPVALPARSQIALDTAVVERNREFFGGDDNKKKTENNPWMLENYLPHKKAANDDKYKAPSKNMDATKKLGEEANNITNDVNNLSRTSNNHNQKLATTSSTSTFAKHKSPNESETFFNHGNSGSINEEITSAVTLQSPNQPKGPKHPKSELHRYEDRVKPKALPVRTTHRSEPSKKNTSKRKSAKDTRRHQHRSGSSKKENLYINASNFIQSPNNPDCQDSSNCSSDQDHSEDHEDFVKSAQNIFRGEKSSSKSSQFAVKYPQGIKRQQDSSISTATTYGYMEAKISKQGNHKRKIARESSPSRSDDRSSSSSKHFKPSNELPPDNASCWFCPLKVTIHSSRRCKSKKKTKKIKSDRERPLKEVHSRNSSKRLPQQHEESSITHQSTTTEMSPPIIRKANHVTVCPASTSQASQQHLKRKCSASPQTEHTINHSFYVADDILPRSDYNQYKKRAKLSISSTSQHKRSGNNAAGNEELFCSSQPRRNFCQDAVTNKSCEAYLQEVEEQEEEIKLLYDPLPRGNTVVSEPDSSWPEQERLMQSDDYSKEGIRLKHEADAFDTNSRLEGSALRRGLLYFEASLMFTMNGHMIEIENEKGIENGSSKRSSSTASANLYGQTILLYEHIRKSKEDQHTLDFRRLIISCLRAEALLHLRIYNLKREIGNKNLELLLEQCKQQVQVNRTPSPWRSNQVPNNQQPNTSMLSPNSPAVPSPYGGVVVAGPSPAAGSTCSGASEHVSSSTQVGKSMSSPSNSNSVFSVKSFEYFRQYHLVVNHLTHSHSLWDKSTKLLVEDKDFFGAVEALSGITLTLHTSLRDMVTYFKAVLRQLRVKSPKE